eukprot:CAMPEP_0181527656 /NCGR_PEP_ID=MMETSP1110-20121109/70118_1 /TAXON_ID=174948 /ORGANISM="Symbiodinium sp., Strain CCMP421" /LENGTH=91 /DNA_ID=CAMNT_0023658543 /DNA_START=19 /DNA_END=291 /DNA_ORIENTATION=+
MASQESRQSSTAPSGSTHMAGTEASFGSKATCSWRLGHQTCSAKVVDMLPDVLLARRPRTRKSADMLLLSFHLRSMPPVGSRDAKTSPSHR